MLRPTERTEMWLVTARLAAALARRGKIKPRIVIKREGETWIEGLRLGGDFGEEDG